MNPKICPSSESSKLESISYAQGVGTAKTLSRRKPSFLSLSVSIAPDELECHEDVTRILDFLLIGGEQITYNKFAMKSLGITHIINSTRHCENLFSDVTCTDGFHYLQLSLMDKLDQDISAKFPSSFDFIEEARVTGGRCLVHCSKGMSRSAAIVIAYLVKHDNMTLLEAMKLMKGKRRQTSPNPGFVSQLLALEKSVHKRNTIDISKYSEDRFANANCWTIDDDESCTFSISSEAGKSEDVSPWF